MDLLVQYEKLMMKAMKRGWTKSTAPCYTEGHHIFPKSWMPNDYVVELTAKEHFTAHRWLHLIFPEDQSMSHAYWMMCMRSRSGSLPFQTAVKHYEDGKRAHSIANSGDKNPSKRPEVRAKMSKSQKEWAKNNPDEMRTWATQHAGVPNPKHAERQMGEGNSNFGNKWEMTTEQKVRTRAGRIEMLNSPEGAVYRSKMSNTQKEVAKRLRDEGFKRNLKLKQCPHCGKEGKGGNMTRYHFENCKQK